MLRRVDSADMSVAAPFSFLGSAQRLWRPVRHATGLAQLVLGFLMATVIAVAWAFILCWYMLFGLLVVPYRLIRRGQRKEKKRAAEHRELMERYSKR